MMNNKKLIISPLEESEIREIFREELDRFFDGWDKYATGQENHTLLRIDEACSLLNISKSWMYKLTSTNQIPHSKRGKRIYFDKKELIDWSLKNKIKTVDEIRNATKKRYS